MEQVLIGAGKYGQQVLLADLRYTYGAVLRIFLWINRVAFEHLNEHRAWGMLLLVAGINDHREDKKWKPKVKLYVFTH